MADLLETQEVVGGLPGGASGLIAPVPGEEIDLSASAVREYVAGGKLQWYTNLPHALAWALDDIGADFGADIYQRMLLDAQVRSVVNVLKAGILEDGLQVRPVIDDQDEDGYQQAKDLTVAVEEMFENLQTPLDDVLWDMMDAIALGNRVAELVFDQDGPDLTLSRIAVRPMESVAFVVDAYMRVIGILGRIPGQPFGVQQGMLLSNVKETANLLPRSKFAVLSFRPKNGDPRGSSLLRAAFDPWNQKQQLKREYLKYLAQFATPSLIGYTAEGAQPYNQVQADGSPALDAAGRPLMQTPEQDMLLALESFANGMAIAFPAGAKVQPIEMSSQGGNPFIQAFLHCDKQITKAVIQQTLATEEAEHQARAATEVHKDVLDTLTRQGKRPVERMLEQDVLRTWMLLNHDPKLLPLMPVLSLGETQMEDRPLMWRAVAALQQSGYLHDSQYADLDSELGLPKREPVGATTMPEKITVTTPVPVSTTVPGEEAQAPGTPIDPNAPVPAGQTPAGFALDELDELHAWRDQAKRAARLGTPQRAFDPRALAVEDVYGIQEAITWAGPDPKAVAQVFELAETAISQGEPVIFSLPGVK